MNGDEKIVNAIINDAFAYADGVTVKAQNTSLEIINNAQKEVDEIIKQATADAQKQADTIIRNKRTLISIENKKSALNLKRELLDEVYLKATEKLNRLEKDKYLALIEKIITKHANKGEEISLSVNAPITEKEVEQLKIAEKLCLNVKKDGNFGGGIIIKNDLYDKRFTFDAIVSELREKTESNLTKQLFD